MERVRTERANRRGTLVVWFIAAIIIHWSFGLSWWQAFGVDLMTLALLGRD